MSPRTIAVIVVLALCAAIAARDHRHHAWLLGALLPLDTIAHVSPLWFDGARYIAMAWLAVRLKPNISERNEAAIGWLAGLIILLGVWQGAFALWRHDGTAREVASAIIVATPFCLLLARRVSVHRFVFGGFLTGATVSALVVISQFLGFDAITPGGPDGRRNPGLGGSTAITTWHMAIALIIAGFLVIHPNTSRLARVLAASAALACGAGLLLCGAQGGLIGLAAAAVATALAAPRAVTSRWRNTRSLLIAAAAVLGIVGTVVAVGIWTDAPTVSGVLGEGDYRNERARIELNTAAVEEIAAHPLIGIGTDVFEDTYGLMPHLLPLDSGVASGIVGLLLSSVILVYAAGLLLRARPPTPSMVTWFGAAMAGALLVNSLTERDGAIIGFSRSPLLFMALVAARGELWTECAAATSTVAVGIAERSAT